jgi:hypothetical protein
MLLDLGVHMIPRLRAGGEDIHHRPIDRRVIQASRLQSEDIRQPFQFHRHLAAAFCAKSAFDRLAGLADDLVITRLSTHLNWPRSRRRRCHSLAGSPDSDSSTSALDQRCTRNGWPRRQIGLNLPSADSPSRRTDPIVSSLQLSDVETMSASGVRRGKAALSRGCKAPPGNRSSRKQPEQLWR